MTEILSMGLSPGDPHSYSRPELACVTDIHLELNVDFDQKILKGKAKLKIARAPTSNEVILDSYGLVISSVTINPTKSNLEYQIGDCGIFGSKFTVHLPQVVEHYTNRCEIEIEYETSSNSPALYWLRPEQTASGKHPFLLSNNKYTFARAVFPCQDTPSVKFTYSADIAVPLKFTVLMSAPLSSSYKIGQKYSYCFSQIKPIPSYAVIIAVGVLQYRKHESRIGVWFDKHSYLQTANTELLSLSEKTEAMLKTAENLCGAYPWDSLNICVLPPSVSHFEIECPCLIFVSPTLLGGDYSLISSIARNISQHWTGLLVTCSNFEHLWLNNCFSMYIQRRILDVLLHEDVRQFICVRDLDDVRGKIKYIDNTLLKCLLPKLVDLLPHNNTRYVLYERGCLFLVELQNILGGASVFGTFLKSYLTKFTYKSIKTDDWISYLYDYFRDNIRILNSLDWNLLFYVPNTLTERMLGTVPVGINLASENACFSLAKKWVDWNVRGKMLFKKTDIKDFCDLQKIYFLNHLRVSHILGIGKMKIMTCTYELENQNDEIRFVWLRLCIKNRWMLKVPAALNFAIKFCSPRFTYPIFKDLYKWKKGRDLAIETYSREDWKILDEIKKNIVNILHIHECQENVCEQLQNNNHDWLSYIINTESLRINY